MRATLYPLAVAVAVVGVHPAVDILQGTAGRADMLLAEMA
jgi:hypothetical protein